MVYLIRLLTYLLSLISQMVFYSVGMTSYFSLNWFFSHRQNAEKSWKSYLSRDDSWMTGESDEVISLETLQCTC